MSTMRRSAAVVLVIVLSFFAPARAGVTVDPQTEGRIDQLLRQMTLQEKLGQLSQFSSGQASGPATGKRDAPAMIAAGLVGSFLNVTGAQRTNELQKIAVEKSRLKIPLLFGLDVIHGYHTTFPIPLALSATWDPDLARRTATVAAREASADGIRWTFAPMVDIARDPRWGRIAEGAGEDPYLGAAFARAYVRGYQGQKLDDPNSIAACAKHYVGYGAAEAGRDYNSTEISELTLREIYLPPFKACVDEGALTLMSAFNAIDAVPASANPFTLDQVLRKEWGFRGFVVSDWAAISELVDHGIAKDAAMAGRKALSAGVDMDMADGIYLNDLAGEVESGRLSVTTIDEAVRRVLRVKMALGLFEHPYTPVQAETADPPAPTDLELARAAAEESFVLLKNAPANAGADAVLPLSKTVHTIALIGPLADAPGAMLGSWAGRGDSRRAVSLRAALAEYAAQNHIELVYEKGTDIAGGSADRIEQAIAAARRADVVLLALGESAGMSGEAASRTNIGLPGLQEKLFDAVASAGKPLVLIVFSGRPLLLTPYVDRSSAIVQAWHPGMQAGPALVRVLFGQVNFSGHLTVTLPRSLGQVPLYYNHLNTGRPPGDVDLTRPAQTTEEKFISRYIDEVNAPLFPFGFGLSYTQFQFGKPQLSQTSLSAASLNDGSQNLKVTARVSNVGQRDGVAVVQLYIRQRGTSVARPVRELKGFERVLLRAGESREVQFTLSKQELAFWDLQMKYLVEPADVTVWIAADSASGESAELTIGP